jgi:type I restriction enzyme M protein
VLFINARRAFELIPESRARRLGDRHADRILTTLARWRGIAEDDSADMPHRDEPDWSRSCSTDEIAHRRYDLMPTSYAAEPPGHESSTRSRVDELKRELVAKLDQVHALEPQLLDALEEI